MTGESTHADTASVQSEPSDAKLDALVQVCETLTRFGAQADPCFVDGFLVAVAASRRLIATAEWLPFLAGDAFERAFADPQASEQARDALETWLTRRREELEPERLLDEPDTNFLTPLFDEWDDDARAALSQSAQTTPEELDALQTGCIWAEGFLACVDAFAADWPRPAEADDSPDAESFRDTLDLIACLLLSPQDEDYMAFAASQWKGEPPSRDELLNEVCFAVQDLRVYWLGHGPKPEQRRVALLPGRNEACHCGSGKKFKKCHGAPA